MTDGWSLRRWTARRQNCNVAIFLDIVNVKNVTFIIVAVFMKCYPFIPLLVTLATFQGHGNLKQLARV